MIGKEKAIQISEKEKNEESIGSKSKADPVFFISLVGVDEKGFVDIHEHIFDIYTKAYDFLGHDVKVKNAQDLWEFYEANHRGADRKKIDIYTATEYFVEQHSNGHYVVDECPFKKRPGSKSNMGDVRKNTSINFNLIDF